MLIDSHCHLTDPQFQDDRHDVLTRAGQVGVKRILAVASDRADAQRVVDLVDGRAEWPVPGDAESQRSDEVLFPRLWGTAGIHPHEAQGARPGDLDGIRELIRSHRRIVAVGETGLDFFYDNSPRDLQEALFREHLALAEELGLPVVVHSRSSDDTMGGILREWGSRVTGVLHCFTGGPDLLHIALEVGWMVSFTGLITFKKYDGQELVRAVPRDRLMVETDAPYLAPVPHRGRRNEPAFVAQVAQGLAALREEDPEDVRRYTSENAIRFFGLR
jgi:TatD DNase family protein